MSDIDELLLPEQKDYADKVAYVFSTHWQKLHEKIEEMVQSKMNVHGVSEQTFINLVMPIFRSVVEEWKRTAKGLVYNHGNKIMYAKESLMTDKIKETWGAEEGVLGEQIKRYL